MFHKLQIIKGITYNHVLLKDILLLSHKQTGLISPYPRGEAKRKFMKKLAFFSLKEEERSTKGFMTQALTGRGII